MKVLFIISSKNPTNCLLNTIRSIYDIQLSNENSDNIKICIVDSDSSDFSIYEKVAITYPDIELYFIKNKNYEYGAWKYAYIKNPNYDKYFCIQDTIYILNKLDINLVNDNVALTIHDNSGFFSHVQIKNHSKKLLENTNLDYEDIIDTKFKLATHCFFVVNNNVMKNIFKTLINPPFNKDGSCSYERIFGIYFIKKNIKTIDIGEYIRKTHGKRN